MNRRPLAAVVSCTRTIDGMTAQSVSERFLTPLRTISDMSVVVVPSLGDAAEARALAASFDAVLLTGSTSNVSPQRYGSIAQQVMPADHARDVTSLALAAAAIEAGRTVFGICRGHQEINVLYGGTLHGDVGEAGYDGLRHHPDATAYGDALARNTHPVDLRRGAFGEPRRIDVVSAHHQGIDLLGRGLTVEATSDDDLVEAVSDFGHAAVLGVQWHPEWNLTACATSREFFTLLGRAARGDRNVRAFAQAA